MNRNIFIFLGPPGSGKGTQSQLLAKKLDLPVIAAGELLRQEVRLNTALGRIANDYLTKGQLVPDELVNQMIAARLATGDSAAGFILDGYPRDRAQLDSFLPTLKTDDKLLIIEIKVGDREVLNRLTGRRICDCGANYHLVYQPPRQAGACDRCGQPLRLRDDDQPEVVKERLALYQTSVAPLLTYGQEQKILISIDGQQPIAKVHQDVMTVLVKQGIYEEPVNKEQ